MDDVDATSEVSEFLQEVCLNNALRRIRSTRQREVALCEFCEEFPVEVSSNGVHGRYCSRCAEEELHQHLAGLQLIARTG